MNPIAVVFAVAGLAVVAGYAASRPDEPWIRGDGWSLTDFPGGAPHWRDLDRVVADRPVYLESADGHTAWVNGRALEMAGITADSIDPAEMFGSLLDSRHDLRFLADIAHNRKGLAACSFDLAC